MDIVRDNFFEKLPLIEKLIRDADFISIDLEMTGVKSDSRIYSFDSSQKGYQKMISSASKYTITQLGLCPFKWKEDRFTASPFNIWIYPRNFNGIKRSFYAQPSSLQFLRLNNFDFNKWVDKGVNFLSQYQIDKIINNLDVSNLYGTSHFSNEDIGLITEVFKLVDRWLFDLLCSDKCLKQNKSYNMRNKDDSNFPHFLNNSMKYFKDNEKNGSYLSSKHVNPEKVILENALILPLEYTNSEHNQQIIQQEIIKEYPFLSIHISQKDYKQFVIIMKSYNYDELINIQSFKRIQELYFAAGAKLVIDMIIRYKKPIIGHNMMLDLMQIYNSFIGPLPLDCNIYKRNIRELFPVILDTKKIASQHQILYDESKIISTVLSHLFKTLLNLTCDKSIKIELDHSFTRYNLESFCESLRQNSNEIGHLILDDYMSPSKNSSYNILDFSHEAGFDALLTGICFINLGILSGAKHPILPTNSIFQFDVNIVSFSKNIFDFNIDNDGESRKMLFYFTGIKDYKSYEIKECFASIGRSRFHRIDDNSGVLEFLEGHMTEEMINKVTKFKKWSIRSMVDIDREEKESLIQTINNMKC